MELPVAIVGATGMLARPLVRRLHSMGRRVRCVVRSAARARALLPTGLDIRVADLRNPDTLARAVEGCAAIYTNLSQPFSERAWDPDLAGTEALLAAAKRAGVKRFLRISALGCPQWHANWWVIERKARADDLVRQSGLSWTIFKPTWLMESLPLYVMGPVIVSPPSPRVGLHWISGDDFAQQVIRAIDNPVSRDRDYLMQGREPVTMRNAVRRFRAAYNPGLIVAPMLAPALGLGAVLASRPRYLRDVLAFTWGTDAGFVAAETWRDLGEPAMSIEDYARSIATTGDVPRK